jgi:hypothetical protein
MPDIDIGTKYYSTTNKYCSKRYTINGGTHLIKAHLKEHHSISELSICQERSGKMQISIQGALIAAASNPQKRRCLGGNSEESDLDEYIEHSVNPDQLGILLTTLITECNLPLCLVESPSFRNFLVYLNRQVELGHP